LIIAILLHQFVEGRAPRACRPERQLQPERGKQFGNFRKAQLPGASVFQRVESSATDARLAGEFGLAEFECFAAFGDLAADGDQVLHIA
jgi:hypothetical protein